MFCSYRVEGAAMFDGGVCRRVTTDSVIATWRSTVFNDVHQRLQAIESADYDGATFEALSAKIVEAADLVAKLDERDPDREACEIYAPLLWGGASGATIEPHSVKAALARPNGADFLQSWSGMGRVLLAFRVAA